MLSIFLVLALIVATLVSITTKRHDRLVNANPGVLLLSPVPLTKASVVLGIGLGGFIDGIVLHQILQWHEMLSDKIPATDYIGKSVNMFWDGIFHLACLIVVITGILLMWKLLWRKDVLRSGKLLVGGMLFGWGIFNIVEGIIDHHIFRLHNVMEYTNNHDIGNYIFMAISVFMLLIGYSLIDAAKRAIVQNRV
jgi:uncharacterized membrane protein